MILDTILGNTAATVLNAIKSVLSSFIADPTQKAQAEAQIKTAIENTMAEQIQDAKETITAEEMGNWLQKSWRPIVMLSFTAIILYQYFISQVFHLQIVDLPSRFFDLLEIGIGGYMGLRSAEKITTTLTK
jgi:uncharacterized membrane protein (DUF106 family)